MNAFLNIGGNVKNKSSMELREKIAEIITHTHKTPLEQADEILLLFSVSGRSEQLCRTFFPDGKTTSATKCQFCGKEKWEH